MQQGKPIEGEDAVVFLDEATKSFPVTFRWKNHDIFTEVDVYLVRNDKSKMLVTSDLAADAPSGSFNSPAKGRIVVIPNETYDVRYTFTQAAHVTPFNKKYPVFKFRIEMVGNPTIFAESNEFKVVY